MKMAENAIKTATDDTGGVTRGDGHKPSTFIKESASNRREHTLINKNEILSELQTVRLKK